MESSNGESLSFNSKCIFCFSNFQKIKKEPEIAETKNFEKGKIKILTKLLDLSSEDSNARLVELLQNNSNIEHVGCLKCQKLINKGENIFNLIKNLENELEDLKTDFKDLIRQSANERPGDDEDYWDITGDRKEARNIILQGLGYVINIKIENFDNKNEPEAEEVADGDDDDDDDLTDYEFAMDDSPAPADYQNSKNSPSNHSSTDSYFNGKDSPEVEDTNDPDYDEDFGRLSIRRSNRTTKNPFKSIKKEIKKQNKKIKKEIEKEPKVNLENEDQGESGGDDDDDSDSKKNKEKGQRNRLSQVFKFPNIGLGWKKCKCGRTFIDKKTYFSHQYKIHNGPKYFNCNTCEEVFGTYSKLHFHRKRDHRGNPKVKCPKCNKEVLNVSLQSHMEGMHKIKPTFKCTYPECDMVFKRENNLKVHVKNTHEKIFDDIKKEEKEKSDEKNKGSKTFSFPNIGLQWKECTSCKIKFYEKQKYFGHLFRFHNVIKYFNCDGCQEIFGTYTKLWWHKEKEHIGFSKENCPECQKEIRKDLLKRHLREVHSKSKNIQKVSLKCSFEGCGCDKTFRSKYLLQIHEEEHKNTEEGKKYPCNKCDKEFLSEYRLSNHDKTVHSEKVKEKRAKKDFQCQFCPFSTYAAFALQNHEANHLNKKYICEFCGKKFATEHYLNNHKKSHGERIFKCKNCEKAFYNKYQLKIHVNVHLERNDRPFKCPNCPMAFIDKAKLKNHKSLHGEERNFSCDLCSRTFTCHKNLYTHKYHVHKFKK